ncbi:MAG: ABC transporter ATP-binding protein [Sedimentibacter sp.]
MNKIIKNNLFMLKYIAKFCPNHIFITIIKSILSSIIPIFYILFTRFIINSITDGVDFKLVLSIMLIFLLFNICYSFFSIWILQRVIPRNTQILNQKMQTEIFNKTLELDLECYEDVEFYNKFSTALQQSDARALAVLNTFSTFIGSIFGIASLVALISSFTSIILLVVVANVIVTFYINTKTIDIQHKYYMDKIPYQRESEYVKRLFYLKEYAKELRLFCEFPNVILNNFNKAFDKLISLTCIYGKKLSKYYQVQEILNVLFNAAIMLYLAYKVMNKDLNIGDFIALFSSSQQLAQQISQTLTSFSQIYEHSIYIENFIEFMSYKSQICKDICKNEVAKNPVIEFKNVSFTYPNTSKSILKNINIKIASGERVAFVGRNGVGKSTIIKLIARLYDPTEGKIILNDLECGNYSINSLRDNIGIIFQDYQTFSLSIAENVLMRPIINYGEDEKIINDALKYVGLYDKIHSLPEGIHTVLNREFEKTGVIFSGGELQKLAIARIYARNSNIIILDEPSSSLDPIAENEIFNSVLNFTTDKTIILISHRLANIKNVDRIFFIENGLLLESGSHEKLMRLNGKYSEMYKIQANNYIMSNS